MKKGVWMYYIKDDSTKEYIDISKKWSEKTKEPLFFKIREEAEEFIEKRVKLKNIFEKRNIKVEKIRVINGTYIYEKNMTHVLEKFIILELKNGVFLTSEKIGESKKAKSGFYEGNFQYKKREFKNEIIYVLK